MLKDDNILVTGGAGTLGRAIAQRRKDDHWKGRLTVYSTDAHKHQLMQRNFPDVQYIQGDIRNPDTLYHAMCGHDTVIHAAAVKVIPVSEYYGLDTLDVNVNGSINVCAQAQRAGIKHVVGISTDKACHPINSYGCSKMMMERIFQEFSRIALNTKFHLVRYGNVLESTGSVIETWKNAVAEGKPIKMTDPNMTRFWLSPKRAVDLIQLCYMLDDCVIMIPKLPALSIAKLAEYTVGGGDVEFIPRRPGEKTHEELLTIEETEYAIESGDFFFLRPNTGEKVEKKVLPYSSDMAPELTQAELAKLLENQ